MSYLTAAVLILSVFKLIHGTHSLPQLQITKDREIFFNKTSYVRIPPLNLHNHINLSFRTCVGGTLFVQNSVKNKISLNVTTEGLLLIIHLTSKTYESKISGQFLDNSWHNVNIVTRSGNITFSVADQQQVVANASYNAELMNAEVTLADETSKLILGEGFVGCMFEGANLISNTSISEKHNVEWGPCPLPIGSCSPCKKAGDPCQNNGRCEEDKTTGNYDCVCEAGFTGIPPNCTKITTCASSPCVNNGICSSSPVDSSFNCTCPDGFTGANCELEIDDCNSNTCKNGGYCLNKNGFRCFCIPGYTGSHCEIDVNECWSNPCFNGAQCIDLVNRYSCVCPVGFTGRDCKIDINECASNPCMNGATCIDGNATFTCICPPGLTGNICDFNIDDCKSSPCLNNGLCLDQLNNYTCNCDGTGFTGDRCEINIDDCKNNPCVNNGTCHDLVKDYHCECFPGYTGKNCEEDINECESNPCQYGGTCLQKSNQSLYEKNDINFILPSVFSVNFSYVNANGYECICAPGVMGNNCEIDIKECDSNPCKNGACKEEIGGYTCECGNGYEGTHCEIEIDECDRYKPCVHGTCREPRPAYYECECSPKYGGKNCSVELIGCNQKPACLNGGTCIPYVTNEVHHKFNCTCPSGFHGAICEKITTMSMNGEAHIAVNTTRDEGYDISFRFKTTLPSGLLALGKGATFYILELMNGRLNLHSSLLNKWEGVFIGSQLNDSNWQKVFVAINSSHVVLAANEEQTIYPINFNEGGSSNWTSFPTTFVGSTVTNLRHLPHGPPVFIGCIENIVINGQWVIPEETSNASIRMENVEVGCQRKDQCNKNPCHSGGQCTDLWKSFSCTCQRPYLGNQCQYNITAATFGHENITNSLVTVSVSNQARKAVRNIVDISMFIRTRQSKGAIFYLGSFPDSVLLPEESHITAELDAGELLVRIQFNGTPESYTVGGVKLNDGRNHLIQVVRNVTLVQVKINGTEYFRKTIGASGPLDAQVLYLGGFPTQSHDNDTVTVDPSVTDIHRGSRDVPFSKMDTITNDVHILRLVRQTDKFENIPHFKGVIQDVQVSNGSLKMVIEFFPLKVKDLEAPKLFGNVSFDPSTVLEGVLSDNTCLSDPCFNGAVCNVAWNDFICVCPRGYKGKQCQEMEFCQLKDCPLNSECRNLHHGYECVSNITMNGIVSNTSLQYSFVHNSTENLIPLNTVDITYRSKTGGTLLYLCNNEDSSPHKHLYFFVFVFNDVVTVAWKLDTNIPEQFQKIRKEHLDGEWTSINIKITDNKIQASFAGTVDEPGQYFSSNNFTSAVWNNLIMSGKIYIGGGDSFLAETLLSEKHSYVFDSESNNAVDFAIAEIIPNTPEISILHALSRHIPNGIFYKGCIGEIRLGGILLPYFTENQLNNTVHHELNYFVLQETIPKNAIDHSCYLCFQTDCKNGGECLNRIQNYNCNCLSGFDGDDCSHDIDECVYNKCANGATCIDSVANYTCFCDIGWSGWLCDENIDDCLSQPCQHNGTCIDHLGYYQCNCTDEFFGKQCEHVKTCENKPCKNGANCFNTPNKNTGDSFTCSCSDGFVGTYCDRTFCSIKPCGNNGHCTIKNKVPMCECSVGFEGKYCDENINDCLLDKDGLPPCFHGGHCIDEVASFTCNCTLTGYKGERCDIDIDECSEGLANCGDKGLCKNENGSYKCDCIPEVCGYNCDLYDPCRDKPCQNGGTCREKCTEEPDYECICPPNYEGKNCTEFKLYSADKVADIALIVGPVAFILLLGFVIGLVMFFMMARNKRATRGTYSPSSQEYCNPRVELDNVMKPPPEERLI